VAAGVWLRAYQCPVTMRWRPSASWPAHRPAFDIFLDCARHLQASYVDQPVLAPLLAWVSLKLFGVSLPGLRVWPSLAAWATVVVGGLTAREFGGRRAQLLAAVIGALLSGGRKMTGCRSAHSICLTTNA
jgi:hypothetical protein